MGDLMTGAVAAVGAVVFLFFLGMLLIPLRLWLQAKLTKTPVSLFDIIGMKLRNCPPQLIVHAMIALHQRGVKVSTEEAQSCYLAAAVQGEPVTTADELATLLEEWKRDQRAE